MEREQEDRRRSRIFKKDIERFLKDFEENISKNTLRGIQEEGFDYKGIICFGMGMTLRDGNREYFYSKLDKHFPGLKEKYIRTYGNSYGIASPNQKELMKIFLIK